jgi:hypothetical protein
LAAQPSVAEFDKCQQSQRGDTPGQHFNETNDGEGDEQEDGDKFHEQFNHGDFLSGGGFSRDFDCGD